MRQVPFLAALSVVLFLAACGEPDGTTTTGMPTATVAPAPTNLANPTATPRATATVTPVPTPSAAPTNLANPTATPRVAATVTPVPTPSAVPKATTTPAAAPDGAGESDLTENYFALDRVLEISIELDRADWNTLRHQTRTFDDLMAEIEEYGLSRPFADIYDWFSGTVTVDGETHADVGVRKKGFLGSQSDTKPSLKLRFDKYVDGQTLGGAIERMTLNNSIQDPSMVNTCLSYLVFAASGNPASRCNFATVTVNGTNLGLYVHVEEIKKPFLERHFDSAGGNLYEGTVSDFTPVYRGTFEKKTNEDDADWSDIDAVVSALEDPSDAGLERLSGIVDLDRFLSFWATEVLVGHWDGYAGDRNNYHFYREPGGRFVFIPWGVDDTFHLKDDPNPFDDIDDPPPSVLALTAIPNRLYNDPEWREKYVTRLREILDTAWDEEELLAVVDEMAAIVQRHALPEARPTAEDDTGRVRKFILKRRGEILADLTPEPPDWPEPREDAASAGLQFGSLEVAFETTWASNLGDDPLQEGTVVSLTFDEAETSVEGLGVTAGPSSVDERILLPGVEETASIVVLGVEGDGSVSGMTLVLALEQLAAGATLVIGEDAIAGGIWSIPAGATAPDFFSPFTEGSLELGEAGTEPGSIVAGRFAGVLTEATYAPSAGGDAEGAAASLDIGLVINEVAARGDPLDWFELYNSSADPIALSGFVVADSLTDSGKRVAFTAGTVIGPGEYMQFQLEKDGWPGFALGSDEELGIWLLDGTPVASVDWDEGQSGEGQSYARLPDAVGEFRTVGNPTPGAPNQPAEN